MMALTIRGYSGCQGRAAKVGSGDPAPLVARVDDCGRGFIVVFAEFFNAYL